jgi:Ca2+/Na+ antiporter
MDNEFKEIVKSIDRMRQEHERDSYKTRSYILFALAWAMLALSLVSRLTFASLVGSDLTYVLFLVLAIVFIGWALGMLYRASKVKLE